MARVQILESKINKAIELLNNCIDYDDGDFESGRFQEDVIKILKGDE